MAFVLVSFARSTLVPQGTGGARAPELARFVCLAAELRTGGEGRAGLDGELGD